MGKWMNYPNKSLTGISTSTPPENSKDAAANSQVQLAKANESSSGLPSGMCFPGVLLIEGDLPSTGNAPVYSTEKDTQNPAQCASGERMELRRTLRNANGSRSSTATNWREGWSCKVRFHH